jgi:hypothetical protein
MKLFSATIANALFALCTGTFQAEVDYFTLAASSGGCIGLKQGTGVKGDRLILRDCMCGDETIQWALDEDSRFRNKVNMDTCMQVGSKNSTAIADSPLRMVECGHSELQQFNLGEFLGEGAGSGPIKVASVPELCVVHKGPTDDIDKDPIFLKKCEILAEQRAQGWKAEYVSDSEPGVMHFNLEAPGGGCIGLKDGSVHRGNPLFLRSCSLEDDSLLWAIDGESRFRPKADMTMCIQAGRTGTIAKPTTMVRIVPCGVSDLQKFDLSGFMTEFSGPIKPSESPNLCMVHRNGPSTVIDAEPIMLKNCRSLVTVCETKAGLQSSHSADIKKHRGKIAVRRICEG